MASLEKHDYAENIRQLLSHNRSTHKRMIDTLLSIPKRSHLQSKEDRVPDSSDHNPKIKATLTTKAKIATTQNTKGFTISRTIIDIDQSSSSRQPLQYDFI